MIFLIWSYLNIFVFVGCFTLDCNYSIFIFIDYPFILLSSVFFMLIKKIDKVSLEEKNFIKL